MRQKAFGRGRQPCGRQKRVAVPSKDADARAWRWLGPSGGGTRTAFLRRTWADDGKSVKTPPQ